MNPNFLESNVRSVKNTLLFFAAIMGVFLIKTLSGLLIPLAFAFFIGLLLEPILQFLNKKGWPYSISIFLISLLTLGFLFLVGLIVFDTGADIVEQKDKLLGQIDTKFENIIDSLSFIPGIDIIQTDGLMETLNKLISVEFLINTSGIVAGQVGTFTFDFFLSAIYLVAVLGSIVRYEEYIGYLEGDDEIGQQRLLASFIEVKSSIVSYMKVKFLTSLCTGVFFGGLSWIFGVDFALFWGFLAFILNFIPTVGSIVATIPPTLLGLIQIDANGTFFLFVALLIATQFIWGNVIEPLLMGSTVALNTVTVILGLVVWGYIWGIAGMLLSVPLIVLAREILAQNPDAAMLVKLMGRSRIRKES